MRLAPVPAAYIDLRLNDPKAIVTYCIQSSMVTHSAPLCLAACAWMGLALCDLAQGESIEIILSPSWRGLEEIGHVISLPASLREALDPHLLDWSQDEVQSTGYVIHSLQAAIWSVANASNFKEAMLTAVNLGGDADTIGTNTGQLAGATFGLEAISHDLKDGLAHASWSNEVAQSFLNVASLGNSLQMYPNRY